MPMGQHHTFSRTVSQTATAPKATPTTSYGLTI